MCACQIRSRRVEFVRHIGGRRWPSLRHLAHSPGNGLLLTSHLRLRTSRASAAGWELLRWTEGRWVGLAGSDGHFPPGRDTRVGGRVRERDQVSGNSNEVVVIQRYGFV